MIVCSLCRHTTTTAPHAHKVHMLTAVATSTFPGNSHHPYTQGASRVAQANFHITGHHLKPRVTLATASGDLRNSLCSTVAGSMVAESVHDNLLGSRLRNVPTVSADAHGPPNITTTASAGKPTLTAAAVLSSRTSCYG